ncbi:MAG: hypothetical protein R2939_00825 [Kofleriaceae bacterium]
MSVGAGAEADAAVVWRDGVHVAGTVLWCDARRARSVCFVSSADRLGRAGHGQLVGTRETLAQVRATPAERLVVPYHRPFTLGTVRLELAPSGHAVGAAMLTTDVGGCRITYAGCVAPDGVGLGGAAAARPCDVLVVEARYGLREHAFPTATAAATALADWAREVCAGGAAAVVLVSSASKGLDVAARLAADGVVSAGHRALHDAARALRAAGAAVPALRGQVAAAGRALIWPMRDRRGLARAVATVPHRRALASGLAREPACARARRRRRLRLVQRRRSRSPAGVRARHRRQRDPPHRPLRRGGPRRARPPARVLAPPRQLALWGGA